jgi:hypothetical protein
MIHMLFRATDKCPRCSEPDIYLATPPRLVGWMQALAGGRLRYRECYRCGWHGFALPPAGSPSISAIGGEIPMEAWTEAARLRSAPPPADAAKPDAERKHASKRAV